MYELIHDIAVRPEPFSRYTAKELWTRPHLSRQMLKFHLSPDTELASRRLETIDQMVHWIDAQLDLSGKRLCDLGCGPGLYAQRFAAIGATVTGVDFSSHSLDYAREHSDPSIQYVHADYLADELPTGFDVVTLIYMDFCVLSPEQRALLLEKMRSMLSAGGHIVMDIAGIGLFKSKRELTLIEERLMDGFWCAGDYVGIQKSFVYDEQKLALDRYVIVEPGETWQIYNWFQHHTPEMLEAELQAAGFAVSSMKGDLTGAELVPDGDYIGVIASAS